MERQHRHTHICLASGRDVNQFISVAVKVESVNYVQEEKNKKPVLKIKNVKCRMVK